MGASSEHDDLPPIASPVVVTGGARLLGREVVRQLVAPFSAPLSAPLATPLARKGADVRVVDLQAVAIPAEGSVRAYRLDLRRDDLAPAFTGARTVFHLAACQYHSPLAPTTYRLPFDDAQFAKAHDAFRSRLLDDKQNARVSEWLDSLRGQARLNSFVEAPAQPQ